MLRGLTTISFHAQDVAAARDRYAEFLGVPAYFQRPEQGDPVYVEFRVGDYQHELGIIDLGLMVNHHYMDVLAGRKD